MQPGAPETHVTPQLYAQRGMGAVLALSQHPRRIRLATDPSPPPQCHLPSSQALTLHLPPLGAADSGSVRALSLQTLDVASDELDASGCPRVPRVAGAEETQTQLHVVRAGGAGT